MPSAAWSGAQALADINTEIKLLSLKKSAFKRGKSFNLTLWMSLVADLR